MTSKVYLCKVGVDNVWYQSNPFVVLKVYDKKLKRNKTFCGQNFIFEMKQLHGDGTFYGIRPELYRYLKLEVICEF
jgi:hypothetical protein